MLTEISCINYKIFIAGEEGNEFNINKICLEQDTIDKKIISYVRLYANLKQDGSVFEKEYLFELSKLKDWLYSLYSIGVNRKMQTSMQVDDNISIKIEIVQDGKAKLSIQNKLTNYLFTLTASINDFKNFQQSWKRAISFI